MDALPSYQEAIEAVDWLQLVLPYCRFSDYHALCLVNRHFNDVISPLLWRDVFKSVRLSGLDPGDDVKWLLNFVCFGLDHLSASTRSLIRILDARLFGKAAYEPWSGQQESTLSKAFERVSTCLPNVNVILLDGHQDLDFSFMTGRQGCRTLGSIQVLSIAECRVQIPRLFFTAPSLQNVVYLDVSYLPGSLVSAVQPAFLPCLRILKARGRELHDDQCLELIGHFKRQLWSLDISDNSITDNVIQSMKDWCMPGLSLSSEADRFIGARLVCRGGGTDLYGPFLSLEDEAEESGGPLSHAERYCVDAPRYVAESSLADQYHDQSKSDGTTISRQDTVEAAVALLTGNDAHARGEEYKQSVGLTHLRLSHNALSAVGIQKLLHVSNGSIEDLACDSMLFLPRVAQYGRFWPPNVSLRGILGAAHCFRPAMSRNLRTLRIHHSVVTNILTLSMNGASRKACSLLAETIIRERIDSMFPETFLPDTNPRLYSLTLTCLPRFSSGPLITKLIQFLKLLSVQEGTIQDIARTMPTRRSPELWTGLRHLRLEFDNSESMDVSTNFSFDAEHNEDEEVFSFFQNEQRGSQGSFGRQSLSSADVVLTSEEWNLGGACWWDQDRSSYVTHHGHWNGETFSVPVWVGPADDEAPEAQRAYRRLVVDHGIRDGVGPVTPAQIQAGAPPKSFIYHIAWSATIMPATLRMPRRDELAGMGDVLDEIKAFRLESRAKYERMRQLRNVQRDEIPLLGEPHLFWTGALEVST
ncbi:hypothetical protein E4U60_003626 [Claviceps pazoutovae]|uniref:F-box domain-containing protein n=1 Tax=Claviceps pazoutovae TaxID=1649127 RepID=A0A9P7SFC7_9HYPO|nr:hypothetical protein E4U60_003626 [Claviceps pazoutovae]